MQYVFTRRVPVIILLHRRHIQNPLNGPGLELKPTRGSEGALNAQETMQLLRRDGASLYHLSGQFLPPFLSPVQSFCACQRLLFTVVSLRVRSLLLETRQQYACSLKEGKLFNRNGRKYTPS
ncbi:hypothetical protein FQA47_003856 [Oryzias melastigma]|uniref:Uncharacterized protein n=1 Tax=Oryzias melastigma TaxID=30732 RepID=A0A834FDH8_ORYME|nr:hypothetical protein FQA47_003856 [Oryzias melastigma]